VSFVGLLWFVGLLSFRRLNVVVRMFCGRTTVSLVPAIIKQLFDGVS